MSIPDKIQEIKRHFRWNNVELAAACGVTRQAINGWVNIGRTPTYKVLNKLAKDYDVNPEWLVGKETNMLLSDLPIKAETNSAAAMRDELRDILLEISLGDPAEADRVVAILRAYLNK